MTYDLGATHARLKAFLSSPTPSARYVLFKGDWCPDCQRAVPVIKSALERSNRPLLEIEVGDRPEWKNSQSLHPLKSDPSLRLIGIPTLIEYTNGGTMTRRLDSVLEEATTADEVASIVDTFLSS